MTELNTKKTQYSVSDFVSWQKAGNLILSPSFQRRSVWTKGAKSYLMDTIIRGLPTPLILLREKKSDLVTLEPKKEVIDGQQRLRTIMSYIDKNLIKDFDKKRDEFSIKKVHNTKLADKPFSKLDDKDKQKILDYTFSVHLLPIDTDDRKILEIFSRLNSTGVKLNHQELRNAKYYGNFKTLSYNLASEQLNRWRDWKVFTENNIARMEEVELTSELLQFIILGISSKSQPKLDKIYGEYEEKEITPKDEIIKRFRLIMDSIETVCGKYLPKSFFNTPAFFYILFALFYRICYGESKTLTSISPRKVKSDVQDIIHKLEEQILREKNNKDLKDRKLAELFETRRNTTLEKRKRMIEYLISKV